MKTNLLNTNWLVDLHAVGACLFLLLGALAGSQAAQTGSPAGTTWDCLLSGKRSGIAYLAFSATNNGTINGYEILVPQPIVSPHTNQVFTALPSNGLGVQPPSTNAVTNIFGFFPVSGPWGFDSKGRIVGYYIEVVDTDSCLTNVVPVRTNTFLSIAPISETNAFEGGFCVTLPLTTNMIPDSYVEQITCYAINVLLSTNSFQSFDRIEATNAFADGHFCITVPTGTNAGNYVETVTCYTPIAPVSTNIFVSAIPIIDVSTNLEGIACITLPIATNMVPASFVEQTICSVDQVNCAGAFTNIVNFTGKAVPGKRLTLTCKTSLGTVTFQGVPAVPLGDIGGEWQGVKRQKGTDFFEFFSLASAFGPASPFNIYGVTGSGPAYAYTNGVAMLSSKKRIALALPIFNIDGSYQSTRAVVGSFNPKKFSGNTSGLDSPGGTSGLTNRVNFQVTKRTTVP